MGKGVRADTAIYTAGLAASRTAAARIIGEGRALANGKRIGKASELLPTDAELAVDAPDTDAYVSRGALKLLAALDAFSVAVDGLACADIGASTGGFTQVLLRAGARHVYAVDVGANQLASILREDPRVSCMEHTNARAMTAASLPEPVSMLVYDVSFISATLLFPAMRALLAPGGRVIGLIKPQFEAGRQAVGKGGIVKDPREWERSIRKVRDAAPPNALYMTRLCPSPIRGGDGNVEFLALFEGSGDMVSDEAIARVVFAASPVR